MKVIKTDKIKSIQYINTKENYIHSKLIYKKFEKEFFILYNENKNKWDLLYEVSNINRYAISQCFPKISVKNKVPIFVWLGKHIHMLELFNEFKNRKKFKTSIAINRLDVINILRKSDFYCIKCLLTNNDLLTNLALYYDYDFFCWRMSILNKTSNKYTCYEKFPRFSLKDFDNGSLMKFIMMYSNEIHSFSCAEDLQ